MALDNISVLFDRSSRIYLERTEKIFTFYAELLSAFLAIEANENPLERPKPKMVFSENYKQYQENRAVQLCKQKGYLHPKLSQLSQEKQLKLKENKSAQKEDNLKPSLSREEVESQLNELTAEMVHKKNGVTSQRFFRGNNTKSNLGRLNHTSSQKSLKILEEPYQRNSPRKKTKNFELSAGVENEDYFESERDAIRKNYEERKEQYLKEKLSAQLSHEKEVHPGISRLYQVDVSDYKKKLIKNAQVISRINSSKWTNWLFFVYNS